MTFYLRSGRGYKKSGDPYEKNKYYYWNTSRGHQDGPCLYFAQKTIRGRRPADLNWSAPGIALALHLILLGLNPT